MTTPYCFEDREPPRLTEAGLREELRHRALRRQTRLLRAAALLMALCFTVLGFFLRGDSLALSVLCLALGGLTVAGNGVISVVFFARGGLCF